jgi:hypothetical protein
MGFGIRTLETTKQQQTWPHPSRNDAKKHEHLLDIARDMQKYLPPRYRKMFPAYANQETHKEPQNLGQHDTKKTVHS